MQIIPIPYLANIQSVVNSAPLRQAQGLIWYHNGQEHKATEWLSAWPIEEYEYLGNQHIRVTDYLQQSTLVTGDWFEFLKAKMPDLAPLQGFKFNGGLAGHFAYDLGLELHDIQSRLPTNDLPLATVGQYLWCIAIDHSQQKSWLLIQDHCPTVVRAKIEKLLPLFQSLDTQPATITAPLDANWDCNFSKTSYKKAFESIKEYIIEGDVYQINLTRQWQTESQSADDWALYLKLIAAMPAPFSVFHRAQSHSLLSVSPERFIQIVDGKILTQPIKGTRPRSAHVEEDERLRQELLGSEKDKAENLMIVDLLRNDIAKSAVPGSVTVDKLFEIQSFKNVHHLVSSISANIRPNVHPLDVLKDAFPGGSITGAPKKRAMQIIDELETVRRGNYCGCSFYLTAEQQLDSNILIRTITRTDQDLTCSGGGGIVHDSQCEAEFNESSFKVERILQSISN